MRRILILDPDHPRREQLTEALRRAANTEVLLTSDTRELVLQLKDGAWAAVFVDRDLLDADPSHVIAAVRSSSVRPMLVVASNDKTEDLDPDLVTLVVRKPYDVLTLTGVLLSALLEVPKDRVGDADTPAAD